MEYFASLSLHAAEKKKKRVVSISQGLCRIDLILYVEILAALLL